MYTVFILIHAYCASAGRGACVYYVLNKVVREESEYKITQSNTPRFKSKSMYYHSNVIK